MLNPWESLLKTNVTITVGKNNKKRIKFPAGWNKISKSVYNNEDNFVILTGKKNNILVIDIDNKEGMPGLEWFNNVFGSLEKANTLVTSSWSGGYHIYFKYHVSIKSTALSDLHIDILSDNKGCVQGKKYDILYNKEIREFTNEELRKIPVYKGKHIAKITELHHITRDEENIIEDFIIDNYGFYKDEIVSITIDQCIYISLNSTRCPFIKRNHSSNHQYIIINSVSSKQKCHDSVCKNKVHREIKKLPLNLKTIINKYLENEPEKVVKNKELVLYKKVNLMFDQPESTSWEISKTKQGMKAVPDCTQCLVDPAIDHEHDQGYSELFITNDKIVTKNCNKCGNHVMSKTESKKVINVFNVIMNISSVDDTIYMNLQNSLLEHAKELNYKRLKNSGVVYKQVKPYSYVRYSDPDDFINEIFAGQYEYKKQVNNMDNLLKFMKQYDDPEFPFIKYNPEYIGFKNGIYNVITCEFLEENSITDSTITVKKYIDCYFTGSTDTPLIDKVLDYQFSPDTRDFLYACLGRLFNIRDTFEFFIFLLGEPGCGKSVILETISACFADVGIFSNTFEPKYGLSYLYEKDIVVCDDLPDNFHEILKQDIFQSIISNKKVSTAAKNGDAIQIERWPNGWILASNYIMKMKDKGQISRRTMTWNFEKNVYDQIPTLLNDIIRTELPAFIYKCTRAYNELLEHKHKSIWKICPEYFLDQQEELKIERNPLYKFLLNYTRYKEGNVINMDIIREKFSNWISKNVRSLDNGTFGQVNSDYIIEKIIVCKNCNTMHKKGCCSSYNRTQRSTKTTVKNIEFYNETDM